jgi:hypothetical protein
VHHVADLDRAHVAADVHQQLAAPIDPHGRPEQFALVLLDAYRQAERRERSLVLCAKFRATFFAVELGASGLELFEHDVE